MAQINKPNQYFNTKLYTGTGSSQGITGVGFQPDFTWIKTRNDTQAHNLIDVVRGVTKTLECNEANLQFTDANGLTAFGSDGFTVGSSGGVNGSGDTLASWNWLANGTGSANTDGSISSTVSANTTSGFSIIDFNGTEADGSVGHGLGVSPSMFIMKRYTDDGYSTSTEWYTYHKSLASNKYLTLQSTSAEATNDGSLWNTTTPVTNAVINIGFNANSNNIGCKILIYAFAEKQGFSKFGSYTGNGSADGTFVYTGQKSAFIMIKRTDVAKNWYINDNLRNGYNPSNPYLSPNLSAAETGGTEIDILSNGFKLRASGTGHNQSGGTYIYMAIAENPLVGTNNIPATAR